MMIPSISAFYATSAISAALPAAAARQNPVAAAAVSADTAHISQAARDLIAAEQGRGSIGGTTRNPRLETNLGAMDVDLDAYFAPDGNFDPDSTPLLLPGAGNVAALSAHVSARMPGFLAEHGIPEAPASISYDSAGRMQLPADYPYAEAFSRAVAENPVMARQLSTTAALASVTADMEKSLAFQREYRAAGSAAEIAAVLARHAYLFADDRYSAPATLNFGADGKLLGLSTG